MKNFPNIFDSAFFGAGKYWNIFFISFVFYYYQQVLFTIRVSSLSWPLSDASGDIINDDSSLQFSPETEFPSTSYAQITLAIDTEAESPCFAQLLECYKLVEALHLHGFLNELLLETE